MFKMLEIIGSSQTSYSQAVKEAIDQLISMGEKVHFFEIIEQRGAVRDNKFKEFQVKLKVAVEFTEDLKTAAPEQSGDNCPTCQKPVSDSGHLCVPAQKKDEHCQWCGALIPDERHLCDEKVKELSFICNSCGRTAVKAEHLCQPRKITRTKNKAR